MRKLILGGLTVAVVVALVAWTATSDAHTGCDGTTINVHYGDEPGTHTAAVTFNDETKTQTVNAEGGGTIPFHFTSHDGGSWSYKGTWSESSEIETDGGELAAVTDCEEETPPTTTTVPPTTTTNPPVDKPEKPQPIHGTATDKARKAPTLKIDKPRPEDNGIPAKDAKVPAKWHKFATG